MPDRKPLRRDKLESFLGDRRSIIKMEQMMNNVEVLIPAQMSDLVRKDTLLARGDLFVRGPTDVQRLVLGSVGQLLRSNGTDALWTSISPTISLGTDLTGSLTLTDLAGGTLNATLVNDSVGNSKLRDSAALSVIGRSANSAGDPADIAAANDGEVLRRNGTAVGFGTVATAGITNDAVTNAKLADMVQDTIKGRTSGAGTGDPVDLTATQVATIISSAIATALTLPVVASYTPTLTNVTNVSASTANLSYYIRLRDMVFVWGFLAGDATAAGAAEIGISLPVASNFTGPADLIGIASTISVAGQVAGILADVTNDRARLIWIAVDLANNNMFYLFAYRVI
jgi:hypothetical protein